MDSIVMVSPDEKEQIHKYYDVNETQIKEYVELIQAWIAKQPHLPQNLKDDFIEKMLLRNKFKIERTKKKLENYFSLRGSNSDLIRGLENIAPSKHPTFYILMPKLSPNLERIIIVKIENPDPDQFHLIENIQLNLAVEELTLQYDYAIGIRLVMDFKNFALKHLTKMNPIAVTKEFTLLEQAYSCRILGIELFNFPSFTSKLLAVMKIVLRPKIYERIRLHRDLDSLHKIIPMECLPSEYGGTVSNMADLLGKLDAAMKNHHDFFLENYENISQEHLRVVETKTNDEFGVDGTFKKLAID